MAREKKTKTEITGENFMNFSARELFDEIQYLRNQTDIATLKKDNKALRQKFTRILNILSDKNTPTEE